MLGPWLERACIEFGGQFRSEYTIHGNLVVNPLALALVHYHLPYVQSVAWHAWSKRDRRKREHTLEFGDLLSAGLEGIAEATRRWKPGDGGLNAYARLRIWGSIYNALYDDLHPRGTAVGTPPIINCSYSEKLFYEEHKDPEEIEGNVDLTPDYSDISGMSRPKKKNKGRSPCLLTGYYTERRDLYLMRTMGRQGFADYLVWRDRRFRRPIDPPEVSPAPSNAPIVNSALSATLPDDLELRALDKRANNVTTNIKQKVAI
jgi:hypothetical protein